MAALLVTLASPARGETLVGYYVSCTNSFGFAYSISTQNWTTIAYQPVEKFLQDFFQDRKPPVFTGAAHPGSHPCDPAGCLSTACYPGARGTHVNGIDGGNMVGFSVVGDSGPTGVWNGFLYDGSTFTPLPGPVGADKTFANAIHGALIGGQYNTVADQTTWLGFLYDTSTSLSSPFVLPFTGVTMPPAGITRGRVP